MGEVIHLPRPRKGTIRGAAREMLTLAFDQNPKPHAVLIVVLAADGKFAVRTANYPDDVHDFDMYSRAAAVLSREASRLLD